MASVEPVLPATKGPSGVIVYGANIVRTLSPVTYHAVLRGKVDKKESHNSRARDPELCTQEAIALWNAVDFLGTVCAPVGYVESAPRNILLQSSNSRSISHVLQNKPSRSSRPGPLPASHILQVDVLGWSWR